ncbi:hypothetical protein QFA96_23040 [Pseudomonas sp. Ap32]|nr:hypothetical protein QFA96_23040 [Pseudomonas sp. Ap32]
MSHARARQAIEIKLMAWAAARPIRVANFEQGSRRCQKKPTCRHTNCPVQPLAAI